MEARIAKGRPPLRPSDHLVGHPHLCRRIPAGFAAGNVAVIEAKRRRRGGVAALRVLIILLRCPRRAERHELPGAQRAVHARGRGRHDCNPLIWGGRRVVHDLSDEGREHRPTIQKRFHHGVVDEHLELHKFFRAARQWSGLHNLRGPFGRSAAVVDEEAAAGIVVPNMREELAVRRREDVEPYGRAGRGRRAGAVQVQLEGRAAGHSWSARGIAIAVRGERLAAARQAQRL